VGLLTNIYFYFSSRQFIKCEENDIRGNTNVAASQICMQYGVKSQSTGPSLPKKYVGQWDFVTNKMTWQRLEEGEELMLEKDTLFDSYYPCIHYGKKNIGGQGPNKAQPHDSLSLTSHCQAAQLEPMIDPSLVERQHGVKSSCKKKARSTNTLVSAARECEGEGKRKEAERKEDNAGAIHKKGRKGQAEAGDQPRLHP
jgi:hypothetical protein